MSDTIIRAEHLSKQYKLYNSKVDRLREALSLTNKQYHKPFYALNDISFEIERGESVGIVGVNGAGKSTLLKLITGVSAPSSGKVQIGGKVSALLELGTGFNPEYSGLENIYLNGTIHGYSRAETEAKIAAIEEFAEIGEFIYQPVKTYSSGMFARLAFAVACNMEPEILIVDEALSVGDLRFQMKCLDWMQNMVKKGVTTLFVSHDVNVIRRFCTRAIWIDNGRIREDGEVNTVADAYTDYLRALDKDSEKATGSAATSVFGKRHADEETGEKTQREQLDSTLPEFSNVGGIAKIMDLRIWNSKEEFSECIDLHEPVSVEVIYDVYEQNIESPVLGVAVFRADDTYMCGLNTLLDKVEIPWKYGRNSITLSYPKGLLLLGGNYYFDVALLDKTATAEIQYIKKYREFKVTSDYLGEGEFIIPHQWRNA